MPLSKSSCLFGQSEYSLGEPYILTKHGPNVGKNSVTHIKSMVINFDVC